MTAPHPASELHHEHLVRINDPTNPASRWLTRDELWEGLRHTVLVPQTVDTSIDRVTIKQMTPTSLQRVIRRGIGTTTDSVDFEHQECLTIQADRHAMFAGSQLTIRIEEPAPGMLFVRFIYALRGLESNRSDEEDAARCAAYMKSDIERIRQARRFVAEEGTKH